MVLGGGYNLGNAVGSVVIDVSGVSSAMRTAKTDFDAGITGMGDKLDALGRKVSGFGSQLTGIAAPFAGAFGVAVAQAVSFDEAVTNIGAILGLTREEIGSLGNELRSIGVGTRAGPQAVANAYYDIVGGVADASTHMAILNAAVATSEAGNADLSGTTKALISVMNSYGFSAEQAAYVSDVLTQTVGMGVGTMDEFAGALPNVAGLASSLGISFEDLGGMMAFLTTKGNTASESATQLASMMTAMLNPNEDMKTALGELGFESGQAAIEQLGLVGAFQRVSETQTASSEGIARLTGNVNALRGVTSFAGGEVAGFFQKFSEGAGGATDAARQIQMGSAAAQFDLLRSSLSGVSIEIGTALLPSLMQIVQGVAPVLTSISQWVTANPQAVTTMAAITAGALALGIGLQALGTIISTLGTITNLVSGVFRIFGALMPVTSGLVTAAGSTIAGFGTRLLALLGPIGAVAAALAALIALFQQIQQYQQTVATAAQGTSTALGGQIASGQISQQQYEDAAFRAVQAQFGDALARVLWDTPGWRQTFMSSFMANAPARDSGGMGVAGQPYLIGRGAQPELFIPSSSGQFVPNAGGAMGGMTIQSLVINANDEAGGRAAARGFEAEYRQLMLARGNG